MKFHSTLFSINTSNTAGRLWIEYNAAFYNCTIVKPSDFTASTAAMVTAYGAETAVNCAFFGFTNVGSGTYTTCYCDDASPPTGCTTVTYANQFENTTMSTRDFRLKTGADCIDNGTTNAEGSPSINGVARSTYDVGAWEFVAAGGGGGSTHHIHLPLLGVG